MIPDFPTLAPTLPHDPRERADLLARLSGLSSEPSGKALIDLLSRDFYASVVQMAQLRGAEQDAARGAASKLAGLLALVNGAADAAHTLRQQLTQEGHSE